MIIDNPVWNTTQSSMTVSNSMSMGSTLAMVTFILILAVLFFIVWYAGSTLQRYKRLSAILNRIATTIVCAVIGAVVIAILWLVYIVLSEIFKAVGGFDPMWILYAIGGFAGCAILGAAVLLLFDRVASNAEAVKAENPPKNESDP